MKKIHKWPTGTWKGARQHLSSGNENQNHEILPHTYKMVISTKTRVNKCWPGYGEKGTLVQCWWECKFVQPLWKTVWRFLKKLKIELPYDPAMSLLGIYPKKMKSLSHICTPLCSLKNYSQEPRHEKNLCSLTDEWIKKMWYREVPGSPVVRTPCFHCCGPGLDP